MSRLRPRHGVGLGVAGVAAIVSFGLAAPPPLPQPAPASTSSVTVATQRYRVRAVELGQGETIYGAMRGLGAPVDAVRATGTTFTKVRAGTRVSATYEADGATPVSVRIRTGEAVVHVVEPAGEGWRMREEPVGYTLGRDVVAFDLRPSLWEAAEQAGLAPAQIVEVAKIFEYDVDFNTELADDAHLALVVERARDDAGDVHAVEPVAARLVNGSHTWTSLRWRTDEGLDWYGPDGVNHHRSFLRSPLEYFHVSSGFSLHRLHPVLGFERAHKGTDLAAPEGTPVRAVSDGTVTRAAYDGGFGNQVVIDHGAPYSTSYGHLSSMLVRRGQAVHQGDIIGRVGHTGLATGPHVHYQFMVDGVPRDPMTTPLPEVARASVADEPGFAAERDALVALLGG